MAGERLLLFGGPPSDYLSEWEITQDLALAEERLEVQFETIESSALLARYRDPRTEERAEAAHVVRELLAGAGPHAQTPPKEAIERAALLYVAMDGIVTERQADAVSIVCGPWRRDETLPVPCLALMLFQERGIPAACQGDIDALLTMILMQRVSDRPAYMGGALDIDGALGISHCVLCRQMLGPGSDLQPYAIADYHERQPGPTVWVDAPTGQTVTVARLTQNLESLLLTTAGVVDSRETGHCRNTLILHHPNPQAIYDAVKGHQNHYVVVYGDHRADLTVLAEGRGIPVREL